MTNNKFKLNRSNETKRLSKQEAYDFLLTLEESVRESYIETLNTYYGFEFINKYDLQRYEILVTNTGGVKYSITDYLTHTQEKQSPEFYQSKMKELQKGYMMLLSV